MSSRPPFIVSSGDVSERAHVYPQSAERMGPVRAIGKAAGLLRSGVNLQRLPPGTRSSWPHAEEDEEEFVVASGGMMRRWGHGGRMTAYRTCCGSERPVTADASRSAIAYGISQQRICLRRHV
jgi:hypothetical protein